MGRYHAILFDMDGTLLDTLTDMQDAVNHVLAAHGLPLRTLEEVRRFVGNGAGPLIHRALPEGYPQEQKVLADAIQKEAKVPSAPAPIRASRSCWSSCVSGG